MNPEGLLALYERIADAPDAVLQLRRFVLDLAVRGKLVPQDDALTQSSPFDERKKEQAQELPTKPLTLEQPYPLPKMWHWVRIGDHLKLLNGMAFKPTDWLPSGIRIVRIQNLNRVDAPFNYCNPKLARESSLIDSGSFLISWSGTPGTSFGAFIWDRGPAVLNQHIFRCDFKTKAFAPEYLRLAINGRLDEMIEKAHGGVGLQHITKGKLEAMLIGLPPLAEQRRIVAKVDELMALCDQLEAARVEREVTREKFTAATLARLNEPDPNTFRDNAFFALDALPVLTSRPDQIKQWRQTILNLAVRGRLLPQDPDDEPASELLKRIATEKKFSRPSTSAVGEQAPPFALPPSWRWVTLGELISAGPQNGISPRPTNRHDAPKAITLTATTRGVFDPTRFKQVEVNISDASDLWLREGDLLFQRGNTREYVGMAAIYNGPPRTFLFPDLIMRVRLSALLDPRFVHLAAISPPARAYFAANASGSSKTMPKINQTTLISLTVPLPPLAEQHRIIAKVDGLMALCDQLEANLITADHTRLRLLGALLAEALAPAAERELEAAE
jgi:type I restriction enzyme S subunit